MAAYYTAQSTTRPDRDLLQKDPTSLQKWESEWQISFNPSNA